MSTQTKSKADKSPTEAFEKVVETTKAQVEKTNEAVAKSYGDFASFHKEGVDALIKAGEIWARGAEDLGKAYFAAAQEAAETNSEAAKALFSAKSFKEIIELQSELARKSFDKTLSESTKLSEMSVKVANEAFQPLQQQFSAVVSKVGNLAA